MVPMSPYLQLPVEATREQQFWCLWCISRPVIVSLHLQQACLVPGQELKPSFRVVNHSYVKIQAIEMLLVRVSIQCIINLIKCVFA